MLVVVMSLPPVMKKRDRPLVGDSPARIRVPMVGTVSLGGVVAVANGRCGIPESSPGRPLCKAVCGASPRNQVRGRLRRASGHRSCPRPESGRRPVRRVWGWGKRDGSPQGSGQRRQRSPCGALPGGTERPFKQSQEGGDPGSKQGVEAPRLPYGSSTVACATTAPGHSPVRAEGKPSPRASAPAGCAPRRPCPPASASPGRRPLAASRRHGK